MRVLKIEGAKDPDEFIKKYGPTRFKLLLDGSSSASEYAIARLRERHDLTTDEGKVRFLSDLANLIAGPAQPGGAGYLHQPLGRGTGGIG